jgi:hypothetical protein
MAALALWESAADLAVCGGKVGIARKVFWRTGGEDITPRGHGRSPCMRALRRS